MKYLPFLIFAILIIGLLALSGRNRRRAAALEVNRAQRIGVGTDVMTTSGLHGTVVGENGDGTVTLSIAPGVEVRWELAALRDISELPERYVHDDVHYDNDGDDNDGDDNDGDDNDDGDAAPGAEQVVDLDKNDKRSGADPAT